VDEPSNAALQAPAPVPEDGADDQGKSPAGNFNARGYGKPMVLSFHSGACSGCGSEFAACGTWNGRVGAAHRVETSAALLWSPSSEGVRSCNAQSRYFDSQVLHRCLRNLESQFGRPQTAQRRELLAD
jgi:hypothetical protein